MPESLSYDLFVSYAEADRAWVEGYLLSALEQAGVRCMYESAFALGVPRLLEFERSIQQSKRTLLVISPHYLADGLNEFIATLGQSYGQDTNTWPVIPLIRQSVPLPPRLGMLVGLKATNEKEQESAIAQLCADLKRPTPLPAPPPDCPYPGMKPFGLGDRDRFFGREEEVNQLLEHLRLHPFITVIGPSGSGKSSLVFAGLIPALRESRLFGSGGWRMLSMRPGVTPQTTLKQTLDSEAQQQAARMLLIVDQFEELFTLAKEEAIPFQESLLKLVKTPNVYLVLTVRADFYADLMTSLLWQEIQNYRLEVVPLHEAGLRQAILKPAEAVGVFVEPALVERLVTDAAGEPGVLPLIQETLVLLWQRLERRFLPLRAYEALVLPRTAYGGQAPGQKTGLLVAISRRADQAIKDLKDEPEKQQAIARRIFLRLIQFGEGRADTRRQQSVDSLGSVTDNPALFKQTLAHLVDCRLLTPSGDDKNSSRKIDIAHEALITGWPALQQWITERREMEQTRRRLAASAGEWVRLGSGSGGLLDKIELAEAQRWLDSPDAVDVGYEMSLAELIAASRNEIEAVERQATEQQERELNLIRERLAEEQRARKAAQSRNRVAVISAIILTVLALFSFYKQREAERQSVLALAQASEALLSFEYRRLDALTSAVEAGKRFKENHLKDPVLKQIVTGTLEQAVYGFQGNPSLSEINVLLGHSGDVSSVSFSPTEDLLVSASSEDNTIMLWKPDGSVIKTLEGHQGAVNSVSFSPDGKMIASAGADGTIRLWKPDGSVIKTLEGHQGAINSVSFSHGSKMIASANADGTIRIWNLDKQLVILREHKKAVNSVSFSPDDKMIASASDDGTIKLWRLDGQATKTPKTMNGKTRNPDDKTVRSVMFNPDGKTFVSASWGTIQLWSIDGHELQDLNGHNDRVISFSFSRDPKVIASASGDNTIKFWRFDGKTLQRFFGHKDWVYGARFSPDGKVIASASKDKTIKLRNLDGQELKTFKGHKGEVYSVSFSPDGKMIASGGEDSNIRLWNLDSQEPKVFFGHRGEIMGVNFNPDGTILASASFDSTIKLWDMDGQELKTLKGHGYNSDTGAVYSISFSPDGMSLVSAGADRQIILWNLNLDNLLEYGCNWLQGYLKTNPSIKNKRNVCNKI